MNLFGDSDYLEKLSLKGDPLERLEKEIELMVTDFYYAYMEMRNEKNIQCISNPIMFICYFQHDIVF